MSTSKRHRHFFLEGVTEIEPYKSRPGRGSSPDVPKRNRNRHGSELKRQITELICMLEQDKASSSETDSQVDMPGGSGYRIQFESFRDVPLVAERLAQAQLGIELLNVRFEKEIKQTVATVLVPAEKLDYFKSIIDDYLNEKRDKNDHPRDNRILIDAIEHIRKAELNDLWTDDREKFPASTKDPIWWEVWLHAPRNQEKILETFLLQIKLLEIEAAEGELKFPERVVLLIYASKEKMQNSMDLLTNMAELRRPQEPPDFLTGHPFKEPQHILLKELLNRTQYPRENTSPYICLLDTGVNRGHQLIEPALSSNDMYTIEPAWMKNDDNGHGTQMAGLALFGNLLDALNGPKLIEIGHRLESVKLLDPGKNPVTKPKHYGYATIQAILSPEIDNPNRLRVFGMTVTARGTRDRGRPTAWSAKFDSLAAGVNQSISHRRLLIVSAGNINPENEFQYLVSNDLDEVHDPAQAWNALTVGAFTNLVEITEQNAESFGTTATAPKGGLSPFSTTSVSWDKGMPFKPDVVFEGGNDLSDNRNMLPEQSSLSLITTNHRPTEHIFVTTNATSAATALASRFAAQILAVYPKLWPETVRALIVHSAEWTEAMKIQAAKKPALFGTQLSKTECRTLLRRCGFGVPNLNQALWTLGNSLTMVVEKSLQPFKKEPSDSLPTFDSMHIHNLPWPRDTLERLRETNVEMRVTLSYFIEPNPSRRGSSPRYCYQSHGLRFGIKHPRETIDQFRKRINFYARSDGEESSPADPDTAWKIGPQSRNRGSIHGDIWEGTAVELANRGHIAVYPTSGWWRTRPQLQRYNQTARYALIVSIRTPKVDIDLYTETQKIKNQGRAIIKTTT